MSARFATAFQPGAFQQNAFQIFIDSDLGGKPQRVSLSDYKFTKRTKKKKGQLIKKYEKLFDHANMHEKKHIVSLLSPLRKDKAGELSLDGLISDLGKIEITLLLYHKFLLEKIIAILDRIALRLKIEQEEEEFLLLLLLMEET